MISESLTFQRVNFGPYHPAVKGMLRLVLELEGEVIQKGTCYAGFTHKGLEKILENKTFFQAQKIIENTDQNFATPYNFSYAFALGMEKLAQTEAPVRGQFIRVMLAELGRIFCHLNQTVAIAESVDFHLVTFWALNLVEELEALFTELRDVHQIDIIPGGVSGDLSVVLAQKIQSLMTAVEEKVEHMKEMLLNNAIFKLRATQVGVVSEVEAISWGLSGPALRASRGAWDLRRAQPYDVYDRLSFKIPVGSQGDSFERTAVRLEEILQSISIVKQCTELMPEGDFFSSQSNLVPPSKETLGLSTEAMIHHYKFFTEGPRLPHARTYVSIEGARGEVGLFLSSDGSSMFDRVRLRTPGFFNLQALESLVKGHVFSDLPILLSSFDIYSAEVDR